MRRNSSQFPVLESKKAQFYNYLVFTLYKLQLQNHNHHFFEHFYTLLLKEENLKVFKNDTFFNIYLLEILFKPQIKAEMTDLYTQLLALYENQISKFTLEEIEFNFDYIFNSECLSSINKQA